LAIESARSSFTQRVSPEGLFIFAFLVNQAHLRRQITQSEWRENQDLQNVNHLASKREAAG